jgi:predicted Zn finger-like uncharacterized protein
MKVQCESCRAAYTIDASKIPDEGASAQCRQCGAQIWIEKSAPGGTKTAVCPKCGRPVSEDATECMVCGVVMAKYIAPAAGEDETLDRDEPFRMSELAEPVEIEDEFPEEFSSGIGVKVREARHTPKWLLGGLLILAVALAFFQFGGKSGWFGLFGGTVVTMSEYQQVANGMSYSRVAQIIGQAGEETSRSNIAGVPGVQANVETVSYQWVNPDGSHMNAIFQNDRLMTKAQFGLR